MKITDQPEPSAVMLSAALLLVSHSDRGWIPLLAEHVDDGTGHCASCHGPIHPCNLAQIAEYARHLSEQHGKTP
ncbi:hypothetical protein [Pseudonocardia spinosispora]|uniref:hypothetical protein n=1 Tax=Pseudonocardia spinosispora TaxID=103441 RepID=UPI00040EFE08|nr:hypothetical protein [Pseudonocardia spinosispora]